MAFTGNFTTNTFKTGLLDGVFNFNTGTSQVYKIALYTNAATLNADTTAYTSTGEASGGNYAAGGQILVVSQIPTIGNQTGMATTYMSFTNAAWTGSITARGALIYLSNGTTNPAVCVLDFGSDKTSTSTFTVQFPAVTNTSAIIRIS
jgi:hypothetical protein